MTDGAEGPAVQILSNDHPPFNDIADTYRQALESLGREVITVVLGSARLEPLRGIDYLNLADPGSTRAAGRALRRCLAGRRPRLAICHRYRPYRVLRAAALGVQRTVVVAHEFGFFERAQRRLERVLFARDVRFAGVSPAVQAELGRVVAEPLCLPNALDLDRLGASLLGRDQSLAELEVPPSPALTIGLVGRLVRKKDPRLALAALRVLRDAGCDVRLLVIGDGPLRSALEAEAAGLPVTFCGFVPDARRLLAALDVLLLTSLEVEAFGMVALEAMASGVPVVAGPSPGPQFVLAGTGYYYTKREGPAVADALRGVRDDIETGRLDQRMSQARNRVLREFSVAALARHLDDLFYR